jgi:hypothetical protein
MAIHCPTGAKFFFSRSMVTMCDPIAPMHRFALQASPEKTLVQLFVELERKNIYYCPSLN